MKKTKKIISLLLTIQMLFACTLVPSAMATDVVVETSVIGSESSEELSPMMAQVCSFLSFDWSNSHHYIHFQDIPDRENHTYFSSSAAHAVTSLSPSSAISCSSHSGKQLYLFNFTGAGYVGGKNGNNEECNYILVVAENCVEVVTAYPVQ